jgi:thimet oligopeptidase
MGFFTNIVQQKDYQVDHEALKPYFPLDHVTKELLAIYQELLGLRFSEVADAQAWHPEVRLFEVYNQKSEGKEDPLIGMFYLDMHPRTGKYGHAAVFGLQPGCELQGVRQVPVCAGMMNFSKATATKPSLLAHDEVVTFFHEFGHAMHQMCALAKHSMFAGTAVERDFVEAPSQMLENWCWCEEGLARLSCHFESGAKLPADLIKLLVVSKTAGAGYSNKRQLVYGLFDQTIHSTGKADTAEVFRQVQDKVFPELPLTVGTNKAGSFGHLAGGYHAQYYGYMWSDVFSADMFESVFQKDGIFNPDVGAKYRRCILQPGGSRDAADMLRDFLGRDPVPEPFLRSLGLQVA